MRAELLCECLLVVAAVDRHSLKTHLSCVLDAEMAQSADAVNRNDVSSASTGVAQRVVDRHPCAHEWSSFFGGNFIGNCCERTCGCNHVLGVTAIEVYARNFTIDAHGEVTTT